MLGEVSQATPVADQVYEVLKNISTENLKMEQILGNTIQLTIVHPVHLHDCLLPGMASASLKKIQISAKYAS